MIEACLVIIVIILLGIFRMQFAIHSILRTINKNQVKEMIYNHGGHAE